MGLTKEQELVRDTRHKNMLVSAAAGSGKTFVLVKRIISEILDEKNGIDVDRILVVTFTNAAAAEMKDRIRVAIDEAVAKNSSDLRIRAQATLIHGAHIRTIDSFCNWVVKNYFYEIDRDPSFRIATTGELRMLEDEVFTDLLSESLESGDEDFKLLADAYITGRKTGALKEMVTSLHDKATSFPWVDEWYDDALRIYDINTEEELASSEFIKCILERTNLIVGQLSEKLSNIVSLYDEDCGSKDKELFNNELNQMLRILEAETFKEKYQVFSNLSFSTFPRSTKDSSLSAEELEMAKDFRTNDYKPMLNDLASDFYSENLEEMLASIQFIGRQAKALIHFSKEYTNRLFAEKSKKNIFSFNDIEHMALEILRNKDSKEHERRPVAIELSNHFKEVMVDEYQDSNELQEQILTAVCSGDNYFTVGDVKQSIYAFRQASPQLFIDKLSSYPSDGSTGSIRIDLDNNFRSRGEVLNFCNEVFEPLMQEDMGGVRYDEKAALKVGDKTFKGNTLDYQSEIIIATQNPQDMAELEIDNKDTLEALVVAKRIKELMQDNFQVSTKVDDERQLRPMKYSDVVILMNAVSGHATNFINALKESGIPAYVAEEKGFFEREEIETVLSMLMVIDNPFNDIPLAAVLHSPMFKFTSNRLAQIKAGGQGESLYASLLDYSKNHQAQDINSFIRILNRYRDMAIDTPIHELLESVLEETGYGTYVSALPMGKMAAANLNKLVDEAVAFESTSYKGLSRFVAYIEGLKTYDEDLGLAKTVGENDDAVRIMTIHKSKGLEFPIVFVCGCGSSGRNNTDSFSVDRDFGIALKYKNPETRIERSTAFFNFLRIKANAYDKGELFRKYYVALTRPVDKLIITASIKPTTKLSVPDIIESYKPSSGVLDYLTKEKASTIIELIIRAIRTSKSQVPIRIVDCADLFIDDVKKEILKKDTRDRINALVTAARANKDEDNIIVNTLSYNYPNALDSKYKSKYSVSEIKHQAMEEAFEFEADAAPAFIHNEDASYVPAFIRRRDMEALEKDEGEEKSSVPAGALYGTAMHRFMECFDFAREDFANSFSEQLDYMKSVGSLSEEEQNRIRYKKLITFINSPIAKRMSDAALNGKLYKEKPFVFGSNADSLFGDEIASDEMILVQGIIDVYFEENDGIVLLDYKTDRVDEDQELVLRYEKQLQLYKSAIEKAYNVPVKEVVIYSFALDKAIPL
ncbi:helicase-exonuclease AddAB subunit AddA [Pseudobutyrivibrio xylanivorans]|uniref:helicase-exonuclease AddAB subunit AddA n=1 Tax=Pseudobutyrivibrio xylanivorans TaxID=185007 RepID=UPI00142EF322|nr:helicase-exonuclease AddAB subunit AddA [Pseudobutyrivibrio xylanivorans]